MKRIVYFFMLIMLAGLAFTYIYRQGKTITISVPPLVPTVTPVPSLPVKPVKTIVFNKDTYAYAYIRVTPKTDITLLPNFTRFQDAESLKNEYNCASVINGGFYDKANKPLGYFQAGSSVFGQQLESALFNGFIWQTASNSSGISTTLPDAQFHFVLQTGPMLLLDGDVVSLSINNDSTARRMVAAKNSDNELLFLTVYNEESVFDGPLLEELPDIVRSISKQESLTITDAINLDGGSASAFYSSDTMLSELTHTGSLFCIK